MKFDNKQTITYIYIQMIRPNNHRITGVINVFRAMVTESFWIHTSDFQITSCQYTFTLSIKIVFII